MTFDVYRATKVISVAGSPGSDQGASGVGGLLPHTGNNPPMSAADS
jgi:hypothetical protein